MNRFFILVILFTIYSNSKAQSVDSIIFEQKALDFFTDSLVNTGLVSFNKYKIYFKGKTDSSITYIEEDFALRHINDSILYISSQRPFYIRKPPINLVVRPPIITDKVKRFGHKSKKMILLMHQNRKVGDLNYILLKGFINAGSQAYTFYFILDGKGNIVTWSNEGTMIF